MFVICVRSYGEKRQVENHGTFLKVREIISLYWNNTLTEQADVHALVAKI